MQLRRLIMNPIHRIVYRAAYEPDFNIDSFIKGANQAILRSASLIRERNFDEMQLYMINEAAENLRFSVSNIPNEIVDDVLEFSEDDMKKTFVHSSFFARDRQKERDPTNKMAYLASSFNFTFYSTFVAFINKKKNESESSIAEMLKSPDPLLICNITIARTLKPLGRWKITRVNFFDKSYLEQNDMRFARSFA
ncbi:hypothetical protein DdX_07827 [Ditylenchus destructor]|uniref:Uncharacterized protein n=1 Tax=Ditylenchus destructor TaxID=166010 RepID=A0AAD4R7W0_9BILA|nr:hypothetical protein DdX_07827 [Ditylenchus destructor]